MKKGQISVEYLIVIGFVVFLVISIVGIGYFYASGIRDRIRVNQVTTFASKLISSSESVFYAGEPSKLTITAYLPVGIRSIEVIENDLIISMTTNSGITTMAFTSNVPINGIISTEEGVKRVEVIATENEAYFSET